jgi:hypothetical protein
MSVKINISIVRTLALAIPAVFAYFQGKQYGTLGGFAAYSKSYTGYNVQTGEFRWASMIPGTGITLMTEFIRAVAKGFGNPGITAGPISIHVW